MSKSPLRTPGQDVSVDTKERVSLRRLAITLLGTWLFTVGIVAAFAAYLFSTRLLLTSSGIYSSASAGRLLLVPNISSRAVLLITPVIMTLVAFKLGAEWLRLSGHFVAHAGEGGGQKVETDYVGGAQLSASQFTHLVNVCSTASPNSVFLAARYLSTCPSAKNHGFLLRIAIRTLVPLLVLGYALSAVEGIWLHAATLPTLLPLTTVRPPTRNQQLSRTIDSFCQQNPVYSDCDGEQILPCSLEYLGNSCADAQGEVDILRGSSEAILTANNLSTLNAVMLTPSTFSPPPASSLSSPTTPSTATSLLIPYFAEESQSQLSYTASTTGVRATCENLTPVCSVTVAQPDDSPETGSVLYSGCPGKPGLTQGINEGNIALGPNASWNITQFDPAGVNIFSRGQKANPFPIALAMIFNVDLGDDTNSTTPQLLGGMTHTRGPRLFGLLWCQVEVLAPVKYRNDRGNIEVLEENQADEGSAEVWAISGALSSSGLAARTYTSGQASPLSPASNRSIAVTTSFSRSIAQMLLSTTAGIHTATASIQEADVNLVQATYVPWAPLGVFVALAIGYAVFVGWICWDVWRGARLSDTVTALDEEVPGGRLKVAASRLAEPGQVAFDLIGSTHEDAAKKEPDEIRLRLGRRRDGGFGVHA